MLTPPPKRVECTSATTDEIREEYQDYLNVKNLMTLDTSLSGHILK